MTAPAKALDACIGEIGKVSRPNPSRPAAAANSTQIPAPINETIALSHMDGDQVVILTVSGQRSFGDGIGATSMLLVRLAWPMRALFAQEWQQNSDVPPNHPNSGL